MRSRLGLTGEGSITAPAAFAIAFTAVQTEDAAKHPTHAPGHFRPILDAGIPSLVALYAKLGRMRVLSSKPVMHSAGHIAKKIMDTYLEPDKSFVELRDMVKSGAIDLLREFSEACRDEFDEMHARQF